jgi:hypothetical protein
VLLSDGTVCRELTAATAGPDPFGGTGSKDWGSGVRILRHKARPAQLTAMPSAPVGPGRVTIWARVPSGLMRKPSIPPAVPTCT